MGQDKRNISIDLLKAFSTFGVCFIHFNGFSAREVDWWFGLEGMVAYAILTLCSCAVPLFLIINGYLVIGKSYGLKAYVYKGIKCWGLATIWIAIYNVLFNRMFHEGLTWKEIGYNIYNGIYTGEYIGIRNWFFYTLAIIYLLTPLIKNIFESRSQKLIVYMILLPSFFVYGTDVIMKISSVLCGGGVLECFFPV